MLLIPVTLLPAGDPERAQALGMISIVNVTPLDEISDYKVWDDEGHEAMVMGHRRSLGWLPLLARATQALIDAT